MLLLRLWNYLRGYVIVNVSGHFIEKFINLCANKGIYLWDIKRKARNSMTLKVSIRGFKSLRGISQKTTCNAKILKKVGIPFIKFRYRKRKSFVAGFVVFAGIIYFLCSFIWVIQINGVNKVNPQEILDFLDQNGIKPGIIKFKFDKDTIIPNMIIKIDGIAWTDIRLIGTKVVVDVVERVPKPEIVDKSTPCNIYATNSGVIKDIITKEGVALVKQGDVVKKDQLLITGIVENKFNPNEVRFVHSDGIVKIITWYQDTADVDLKQIKTERTGQFRARYGFKVFSDYHSLFGFQSPYEKFDVEEKAIRLGLWKNYELPIEFVVRKYFQKQDNEYPLSEELAKELARSEAESKVEKIVPQGDEITDKKVEYETINDGKTIRAKSIFECIEDVGKEVQIAKE